MRKLVAMFTLLYVFCPGLDLTFSCCLFEFSSDDWRYDLGSSV